MGRIAAGTDLGESVARPTRFNETAVPRAAFGVPDSAIRVGQQMELEGMRTEREAAHAAEVAARQAERERQQERDAAERATAAARQGVMRDRLADLVGEIDAGVQDGTIGKDRAAAEWQERSRLVIEDGLPEVPERLRELVRVDVSARAEGMQSRIGDAVRKRDRSDTLAGINQTLEHSQRLAMDNPAEGRAIMEAALALGPQAGLAPDQVQKIRQGWIEGTAYTRHFGAVQGARLDNKALGKAEAAISADGDLDPQRRAQLLAQVEGFRANNEARALRAAQRAEIEAARRQRESDSAFGILSGWVLAGKAVNEQASAGLLKKLTPEAAAAYKAMAAEIPARTAAAMLPLDQQQAQLDALIARRNASGTSQGLEQEIKRREQVLAESRRDYQADPLRAAAERGVIDAVAPLDLTSIDGLAAGVAVRVQQAREVATRTREPVSPFTARESDQLAEMLRALPVRDRSMRIAQLASVLPPEQAQALAKQIDPKDRALGLQFAYGSAQTTSDRLVSELIGRGAAAKKDGTSTKGEKEPDVKAAKWRAAAAADLDGVFPSDQAAGQFRDAAELIMHGIAAEQGGRLTRDDMDRAMRLALGGSLVEHNGRKIPLPAGIDSDALEKRLRTMTPGEIDAPGGMVRAGGMAIPVADFVSKLPGQQLMPVAPGRYVPLVGGRPVVNAAGRLVTVGVR